ncbi:bifunctional 2-C-methyl-D-erythritol 4-phosphate cytidylyltransferase/2-C-methyl-D-erythritol 2,4-cyclodiphosphate synthase [Algicella marina]|uniref:Bifunctional enzyme IspD/IspF n=1 Tax=Algicella marina TaxID=2683284 RepID=A0A6P1T032_9RHOB|nr:bifunctional 2-C-methyl-D-erythritol 4-phosphate cytidylyltransferase/2-C-methyl-D-erythritol 2,4-cyclodiphosphate synthase [Algicella marina]QHQ34806.1 bifunctional 2-C-methyl-D-erythritol 4-phosphate cytidylyltransferase/2-C-methyl-D-erythritol 2,4-cyclodiphosphate synthase [Algicella marina]
MTIAALIVAAGRGTRAGGEIPKQYMDIGGKPVLARTLEAVLAIPGIDRVQVVIHPDDQPRYDKATQALADRRIAPAVPGGKDRQASVCAGLEALAHPSAPTQVLIHDAARPFLSPDLAARVLVALADAPAVLPALPIVDALWRSEGDMAAVAVDRQDLWRAQTPQGFDFATILDLHRNAAPGAPDDVTLARAAGLPVAIALGDGNNFKITLPEDFARAETLLAAKRSTRMDVRTGIGYDVHAFGPGDAVTLNGVTVPHGRGLKGHSDADVAMHAITDAIFGALAEGDIGQWFPPSDPQWKGAASDIFLAKAAERTAARGFRISHIDCTIICEQPKIGPHATAMRRRLAEILALEEGRISVKATTSERLGFTGREEGIAATATATLVQP